MWSVLILCSYLITQTIASTDECFYGFCNKTESYPYEEIQQALSKDNHYTQYFNLKYEKYSYARRRRNVENDFKNNCTSTVISIYPKLGTNTDGKTVVIINTETFKQRVEIVQCLEPQCIPINRTVQLVVYNSTDNVFNFDGFLFPGECQNGNTGTYLDKINMFVLLIPVLLLNT